MTNADKYLKDGVDVEEFADKICEAYLNGKDNESVFTTTVEWLRETVKPTLTKEEKVILRNVQMQFALISRDEHTDAGKNDLYITDNYGERWSDFSCFNHLFQFIKPRRRI